MISCSKYKIEVERFDSLMSKVLNLIALIFLYQFRSIYLFGKCLLVKFYDESYLFKKKQQSPVKWQCFLQTPLVFLLLHFPLFLPLSAAEFFIYKVHKA